MLLWGSSASLENANPSFSQLNLLKLNNMYRLFLGSLKHKIMNGVFLGGVDNSNSNTSGHGYSASKRTTIHRPHGRTKLAIDSCTRQRLRFCHLLPEELIILSNMQQFRKKKSKKKISAERS